VRSTRFHEEYKRFYLRDVQAIVIANAPRFHVSTHAIALALVWLIAYGFLQRRFSWAETVFWTGAALMAGLWVYLSAAASCRCRIHTAVSREELPSIYRRRTARKFLDKVEPLIGKTQGILEGDWVQAIQQRPVPAGAGLAPEGPVAARGSTRTWASDLLIAALFASAVVNLLIMNGRSRGLLWLSYGCNLLEVAAAVVVFVQHYRGRLRAPMQRLAIAALVVMGLVLYLQPLSVGVLAGMEAAKSGKPAHVDVDEVGSTLTLPWFRQFDIGASVILGCVGLGILLQASDDPV
jgi:hypothetical protein